MQLVKVSTKDGKTVSFKKLIISKCQSSYELHEAQEIDAAKKLTEINSCKDPEKKKELQLEFEFEKNERRLRKRSLGNCRFMGELFKQKILTPNIMLYCIVHLVTKHDEESLECLCILLKIVGKELEQFYDLNHTFDKLTALTSSDMESKISSGIQFMIQEVIDLRRHKWISEKQDCLRGGGYKSHHINENKWNVVQNNTKYKQPNYQIDQSIGQRFKENTSVTTLGPPTWLMEPSTSPHIMSKKTTAQKLLFPQPISLINSSNSSQLKGTVEKPVSELDSKMANKINMKCKNILIEYEQVQNLDDIIYSLSEDETSVIRTRHEEFVTSISLITLDSSPITRTTIAGKIFAKLLSKKILSMVAITRGIDAVLKEWNEYLMDYPQFFSYIAAIIAPLLLSQNASFDFNNLKDSCTSIRPDNSSTFFTEVLNKVLSSKETQNIKEQLGGILWIYNKWMTSEYVPLDVFMPNNQINKYFKNDRIGIFLLSIAMYDKMKMTDSKPLYDVLHSWISTNISAEIIKCPQFVRALTIAIVIVCSKPKHSYGDFFDHVHVKLLTCYIRSEPLPEPEIQAREVQCLYGIQIMSAALEHPGDCSISSIRIVL
ncbi:eukaryotic translation initiation factor 4 gamma isoform X2 [Acyrthosiphon pisum]|uniref:MI domain-containing protein n=1 Tax=Acyrthosiphon pisum TaxID=7029 RepID=A0A8R2D5R4_ACYPI|nr:eukaryotic translation initiation factor 4 gamma isoform X2 [Acyrthosiphon pisum]